MFGSSPFGTVPFGSDVYATSPTSTAFVFALSASNPIPLLMNEDFTDIAAASGSWAADSAASGSWSEDSAASGTWTKTCS